MIKNIVLLVLAIFLKYEPSSAAFGQQAGPIGYIDVFSLGTCAYKDTLKSKLFIELTKQGKDKIVNGNISLSFDVDASVTFKLFMHKWTGSEWKKNVFKLEGPMCEQSQKFASKMFKSIYGSLQPKVTDKCIVKKGDYKLTKFQATPKDVTLPSIFYGKLKVEYHLYKGKNEFACVVGEGESKPPI